MAEDESADNIQVEYVFEEDPQLAQFDPAFQDFAKVFNAFKVSIFRQVNELINLCLD